MENNKTVELAAKLFVASVLAPVVIGGVAFVVCGAANGISKLKQKRKIKKGLKDGSIIEIDGVYYEVDIH